MIEKLKIFDHEIIKHKVPSNLYDDIELKSSVDKLFAKKEVVSKWQIPTEQMGEGVSTVGMGNRYIINLTNVSPLLTYISKFVLKNYFGEDYLNEEILFTRMWVNRIYKHCSGKCHVHYSGNDVSGTAIFYLDVPKNGSKLIILKQDIGDIIVEKVHDDLAHYLDVESGDLIVHTQVTPHAFSEHLSDDPRTCLIFDFEIKPPPRKYPENKIGKYM